MWQEALEINQLEFQIWMQKNIHLWSLATL